MSAPIPPRGGHRRAPLVPPQHGAWAFLALPLLAALPLVASSAGASVTPALALLAITWIAAYPASYALLSLVRDRSSRHPDAGRYRAPLVLWSTIAALAGVPLVVLRPWLVVVGLLYIAMFAINLRFAARRNDRALANDIVFIAQCTAMVPVTWAICATQQPPAPGDVPARVWVVSLAVAMLLLESTLHVKSLIRERSNARYARLSRTAALVGIAVGLLLAGWWGLPSGLLLLLPFVFLAVRSVIWADPTLRPARLGMIELVGFLLLPCAVALATRISS